MARPLFLVQGVYRLQYKRPLQATNTLAALKNSGLAMWDYIMTGYAYIATCNYVLQAGITYMG